MSEPRIIHSLGVERPGQMALYSYTEEPLRDGQFRVETLYSGFSAGTELTFFKGSNPYLRSHWASDLNVFCDGQPAEHYPMRFLGYMEVGRVSESRTPAVQVGEVVAMPYGHKTGHTADAQHDFFVSLPPDLDPLLGIYVSQMGPICANGLLHAAADFMGTSALALGDGVRGRNVLVIGAGVVGLLTALFAQHHGAANVAVADTTSERLDAAHALGLITINENQVEAWRFCKERWHDGPQDRGADIVFQCRAKSASLHSALRSLRPQGTVIDLAFYQDSAADLRLGEEFHHNGLSIRSAQIARVPRGLAHRWNRRRLALETIELLRAYSSLIQAHLITDVVPLAAAPHLVADLAARKRHTLQAVFRMQEN